MDSHAEDLSVAVIVLGRNYRNPRFIADENRGSIVAELPLDVRVI